MVVESADDLAAFFDTDEFGTVAIIKPAGSAIQRSVNVMFDTDGQIDDVSETGALTQRTSITARTADLPDIKPGDGVTVEGKTFIAAAPVPHGAGLTTIPLRTA